MTERPNIRRLEAAEKVAQPAPFDAERDISESEIKKIEKLYDDRLQHMEWKDATKLASELKILRPNKMRTLDPSQVAALRRQLQQLKTSDSMEDYMEFAADVHHAFPAITLDISREVIRNRIESQRRGKHRFKMAYNFRRLFPNDPVPLIGDDKRLLEWRIEDNIKGRPGVLALDLVWQKALFPENHRMTKKLWRQLINEVHNIRRYPDMLAQYGSDLQLLAADELRFTANGIEPVKRAQYERETIPPEALQL